MREPRTAKVRTVHVLPHRVRLRTPHLIGQRSACERVARALARTVAHERITVRPATGSILVEGAKGTLDAAAIAERVFELVTAERDDTGRPLLAPPRPSEHGPTRLARAVADAVTQVNQDVNDALGHHADLGTILPVAFAAGGIVEVIATGELPGPTWFNLLWWSLRSFMTFNVEAVDGESTDHRIHRLRDLGDDGIVTEEPNE